MVFEPVLKTLRNRLRTEGKWFGLSHVGLISCFGHALDNAHVLLRWKLSTIALDDSNDDPKDTKGTRKDFNYEDLHE